MKRFQSIIQKYITNHQKHKKYLAAVLALSILVSFAVPISLIMPAVSMTQNDTNENYAQPLNNEIETYTNESTGTNEWFDTASDNGEGVEFESKITSITITNATTDDKGNYVINGGSGPSWSGSFTLNYAGVNGGFLRENNPYMYCKINGVKITNAQYGKDCLFIDPSDSWKAYCSDVDHYLLDSQGQPATSGYYSISENGMINIRFTSDYRNYLENNTCEGSIKFEGSIERGDDADGDKEFTIGNNKIKVTFDDKNLGIRKSADWNFYGTNDGNIRWTITIENGNYVNDLNYYFVEDSMFSRGENFKFNPENVGSVDSNGVFRFNESCKDSNGKYPDYITITYETPITDNDIQLVTNPDGTENIYSGNFKVSNIAKLKKPGGTETPSNEATKEIPKNEIKSTITKSGTPSYEIDGSKGYIEWTIEVERKHNLPLKDYVITDEAFKNKDITDITINGTPASITDTSNGALTLDDVGSKAIIKYKVPVDKNSERQYTNKASLTPPSDNKDEPKDTGDRTVTYKTDLFDVTKTGVLNDKNQITWTITIDATINNNAGTLNGFKISDTQFTDAVTNGQLRIVSAENNYVDVTNSVSLNGSGNEYTINGEADKITLEFTRPLTTDEINAQLDLTGNNTDNATNTVTVEDKDGEKEEESGTATLTPLVDGIVKRLKSNNYAEETAGYDSDYLTSDKATKSLEWEVNIDHYRGFSSDSKVFVDVMNATNGGQHYMTQEQLKLINISGTTIEGNNAGITSSDYTIEKIFDSNNKIIRFNVTFNDTVDTKKCVHLKIGYNTTADASKVEKGNIALFSNTASFGEQLVDDGGSFEFVVKDPANVPKHNLTSHKSWVGDNDNKRPDSITVRLERKTGKNGKWEKYTREGLENPKTITKGDFNDYLCQWNDLEEYTPTADKTPYYYRVVELDGDNAVSNGGILEDYTVSYNENGITLGGDGTFTITNTRALADITVHKDWVGDEGKTRPNAVVHLEWKYEGDADSTYQRVYGADVTLDPNNSYNHTWNNLPKKKDGKTVLYRVIENELSDYVTSYTNNNGINSNGTINITNTYKMIDISVNKVWQDENGGNMSAPDDINSLTFKLQKKEYGSTSDWEDYPDGIKTIEKSSDDLFSYTWNDIPIVDEDGNLLEYQVVEVDCPKGYKASYSSSDNKNFTVTNKQSATYSKQAIRPNEISGGSNSAELKEGTNYRIEPISSITADELNDWPTRNVKGQECYIFEWYIQMNPKERYCFEDELPAGATLYWDTSWTNNKGFGVIRNNGWSHEVAINTWSAWTTGNSDCVWSVNGNKVIFDFSKSGDFNNLQFVTYCTAIPKSIIDNAVEADGSYDVINKIKTNDEPNFTESKLTITKSNTPPVDESLLRKTLYVGKPDSLYYQNGTPTYELIVNPEGKNLVNGDTIDITDIFEITGYKPNGGTKTDGSDLLDVDFNEIQVQLIDENGKRIRDLLPNEYNRLTNTEEVVDVDITDYTDNISLKHTGNNWNNKEFYWQCSKEGFFPIGLEICLKIKDGTPGEFVNVTESDNNFCIESNGVTYDENGEAKIKLVIQNTTWTNLSYTCYENLKFEVVSTQIVKRTTSMKTKLQLSVPDEMPLKIVYSYKLKTNSKTPGNPAVGKTPPPGSEISLKNAAEFETSSEKASAEVSEAKFQISTSSATVNTTEYPTIKKVDVGNYSLELNAGFRIAKYDNGTWKYASQFNDVKDSSNNVVSHSPNFNIEESAGKVPTGSAELETVAGGYKIVLDSGALYKLVEVERPNGYIDLGYKSDSIVTGKKPYVFYFTYDGTIPDETLYSLNNNLDDSDKLEKSDIMNFQKNSTLNIPNSNTFSIKVEKEWGIMPTGYTPVSVDVKLGWSYSKLNKIPDSLNELSALGIDEEDTKTITGTGENDTLPSVTWDNLPNGYDGKPIYYYVKEISYKLNNSGTEKTYTLNNDGTYKYGDETGDFKPIYTGNGLNTGSSVEDGKVTGNVHIKNASKLVVKKVWQDSNGEEITDNLPLEEIQFNLDGIKEDGTTVRLVTNGNLKASGNWLTVIDDSVFDDSLNKESKELSQYKQFKVAEVITNDNQAIMYGYIVSDTYNVTEGSGEIVLTNKDKTPKDINVTVNKVWGDGNENHTTDSIEVVLIRSNKSLTSSELKELNPDSLSNGITKVVMKDNPFILNNENNWTKTWEELPYKEENGTQNYYYVLEKRIPNGYEVSYSHNGSLSNPVITINNNVPGSFRIDKSWVNVSGTPITENLPDSITVKIYQKLESTDSAVDETKKIPDNLKVYAEGDSITFGSDKDYNQSELNYPSQLKNLLPGQNVIVDNDGTPGATITEIQDDKLWHDSYKLDNTYDIVTLIAGTNDILNTNDTLEVMKKNLENLIDSLYTRTEGKNIVLFVGLLPTLTTNNWNRYGYNQYVDDVVNKRNKLITDYNNMVKDIVANYKNNENKTIYDVDLYTAVGEQLTDGIHPTDEGYTAIANAFYNKIREHYVGETVKVETPKNIDGLPDDLGTCIKTVTINPDANGNWSLNLTDLLKSDGNGNNYVYYVKEINTPTGWEASYKHNGQLADSNTQIEITNTKATKKINITVNKKWNDVNASDRPDSITLTLQRKTETEGEWSDVEVTQPTPTKNGATWTYTYSNLPKDDGNDNNYQYRIVETVPTGYTVEYVNGGVAGADGNISLTNTKSVSIKLNKIWSDNEHTGDTIKVKLHRSTSKNTDELPLISTTVASTNSVTSPSTETTSTTTSISIDYGTKVSGEYNSEYDSYGYSINNVEAGKVVKVTVVGTPNASVNGCFGYNNSSGSWLSSQWGARNIGSDGKLVLEYSVPDDYKDGFQFQFWNWETKGNTSSNITDVYYKVEAGADTTTTQTTTITTTTSTTTSSDGGSGSADSETVSISPTNRIIEFDSSKNISSIVGTVDLTSSQWTNLFINVYDSNNQSIKNYQVYWWNNDSDSPNLTVNGTIGTFNIDVNDSVNKIEVVYKEGSSAFDLTLNYGNTASQSYSLRSAPRAVSRMNSVSPLAETSQNITFNSEGVAEVKLTYTDVVDEQHWQKLIENLPAYDENNQQYYYWVEEIEVNGYTVSYLFSDDNSETQYCIDATQLGNGEITIKNTKNESSSVTMPSTGGKGVKWYYVTGMAVMFVSAAGILIRRRKNPVK